MADRVGTVRDDERGRGAGVAVVDAVPQVGKCVEIYIVSGEMFKVFISYTVAMFC